MFPSLAQSVSAAFTQDIVCSFWAKVINVDSAITKYVRLPIVTDKAIGNNDMVLS